MVNNDALPDIDVDPETFAITVDGDLVEPQPADRAPAGPALLDVLSPWTTLAAPLLRRRPAARRRAHPVGRPRAGAGRTASTRPALPAYCRTRLATVARTEAATAVVARHHALAGRPLDAVETAWAARTPSDAMRATVAHARPGLLRLARRDLARGRRALAGRRPAAAPARARRDRRRDRAARGRAGAGRRRTTTCRPCSSAALKLLPLDPADADRLVRRAAPRRRPACAEDWPTLTATADIPATGSPQIEGWAQAHARTTRRLFSA